jgi:dephospho-CoA kinase
MTTPDTNGRCRIVLTGGPGGGKKTAVDLFRREIGERVVVVPEAARCFSAAGSPGRTKFMHASPPAVAHVLQNPAHGRR